MRVEQENVAGFEGLTALPDGKGAAGLGYFERINRCDPVDGDLRIASANLVTGQARNMLQQGPVRANNSLIIQPMSNLIRGRKRYQIACRNSRRPVNKVKALGHAFRPVPDEVGPVDNAGGDHEA